MDIFLVVLLCLFSFAAGYFFGIRKGYVEGLNWTLDLLTKRGKIRG